ncbi:MAG: hypothetical protein LBG90_04570 [Spirochaetaceae bacterium]|jgi:hypothetical protein|nr:hypothetical protein [Spirochaetaceae bacterium]
MEKDKKELLDNFLRLDPENQARILARIRGAYTAQELRQKREEPGFEKQKTGSVHRDALL